MTGDGRIRVLHMVPEFGTGGAEKLVLDLLDAADRSRFDVSACSLYASSGRLFEKLLEENGREVFYLGKRPGPDISIVFKLVRLYKEIRPDIVHTHRYLLRYVLPAAKAAHVPVVVHTVHSDASMEVDSPGKAVHWLAFKFLGVIPVAISDEIGRTIKRLYGLKDVRVIYNGIPAGRYAGGKPSRGGIGLGGGFVCIHIGRFTLAKNHDMLFRAFARALETRPDMTLLLAGDGELRPAVERQVRGLGIGERVRLLGVRNDIPELLSSSDLFVLSSDWEGLPLTVMEAMAAGLPVISTAVGGVPDIIEDGRTGYLVEKGDAEGLARAMIRVYDDRDGARAIGGNARAAALDRYDISKTASEYEALYTEAITRRRALDEP